MWQIYGQDHIVRQLDAAIGADRLSHAYLLVGPPYIGKMALAIDMAQAVNCLSRQRRTTGRPPGGGGAAAESEALSGLFDFGQGSAEDSREILVSETDGSATKTPAPIAENTESVPCGQCRQCIRVAEGIHPDVRVIGVGTGDAEDVNRRDIRIEQVREIESFLNLTPYEGASKVVIVDGAELMNTAAANALLKTLEEPPPASLLLLLTASEDALLPTIRSRCSALYLKPVAKAALQDKLTQDYAADPETAERVARLSRGCFGQAVTALQDSQPLEQREADLERLQEICESGLDVRFEYAAEVANRFSRDRDAARELLYLWLRWWRDLLLVKEGAEEYLHNADRSMPLRLQASQLSTGQVVDYIRRINRALEALDANANPRLTLETLMLGLP
ncbi:MAG: hypothetical protein OXN21_02875 [Chloroflexota bacterium]|nr:hypothetical protein [Chloroflexota bacterium]